MLVSETSVFCGTVSVNIGIERLDVFGLGHIQSTGLQYGAGCSLYAALHQ